MHKNVSRGAEEIYRNVPAEEIPWNNQQPPKLLEKLAEKGQVRPGRALDLGCGLGNYAIWLAGKGFDVVGIDASPTAIKTAKQNAKLKKVRCKFITADVTGQWPDLGKKFDFVYDWGLLHHILPKQRGRYVKNVHRVLKPGGKYLSLCFHEKDKAFVGIDSTLRQSSVQASSPQGGKYRNTRMGTVVYLSSKKELRELFERHFKIIEQRVFAAEGKSLSHVFNYCFMELK